MMHTMEAVSITAYLDAKELSLTIHTGERNIHGEK